MSKQKRAKRKARLKREKRRKNRLNLVIRHFTQCAPGLFSDVLEPCGNWVMDPNTGMHVDVRCQKCQLRLTRHNESGEFSIKDVGRMRWDSTVLDLLAL